MSDPCFDAENCNDPDCQEAILAAHEITSTAFNTMVTAYFGTNPVPSPKVIYGSDLYEMVGDVDCDSNRIVYVIPATVNTQQDISISVVSGYAALTPLTYSIALFRGMLLKLPDEIHFYKAKNASGMPRLAYKIIKASSVIGIGNLSDAYP